MTRAKELAKVVEDKRQPKWAAQLLLMLGDYPLMAYQLDERQEAEEECAKINAAISAALTRAEQDGEEREHALVLEQIKLSKDCWSKKKSEKKARMLWETAHDLMRDVIERRYRRSLPPSEPEQKKENR